MKGCLQLLVLLVLLVVGGSIWMVGKAGEKMREEQQTPKVEDPHGDRPLFEKSPMGGSIVIPSAVKRALRERLKDPDSLQVRSIDAFNPADYQGTKCWQVVFTYAAKNSFGAYDTAAAMAYMRGSELLSLTFYDE
jgi:hypothetical protein